MAEVRQLIPTAGSHDPSQVIARLGTAQREIRPFDPAVTEFATDLARRLRRHPQVRAFPAMGALAWWIRPANISRLHDHWRRLCAFDGIVRAPRGVVFHIPPTNVDTMFVYSWLLSALAGNANVIRLSPTGAEHVGPLMEAIAATLDDHSLVAATTAIVTYGHDDDVTRALSEADMRIIWGGDRTIQAIRAVPLSPHATELVFPDRYSFALFDAAFVDAGTEDEIGNFVGQFINDAYWFDQLGCSSPRLVVWRGNDADARSASVRFRRSLSRQLGVRGDSIPTSAVVAKLVHAAANAADGRVDRVDWTDNSATFAHLGAIGQLPRDSPGGGLFYEVRIDHLDDLVPLLDRRDQTLTYFGLDAAELRDFAQKVGARGLERLVPTGQALTFSHLWDGHDLLHACSRSITIGDT